MKLSLFIVYCLDIMNKVYQKTFGPPCMYCTYAINIDMNIVFRTNLCPLVDSLDYRNVRYVYVWVRCPRWSTWICCIFSAQHELVFAQIRPERRECDGRRCLCGTFA